MCVTYTTKYKLTSKLSWWYFKCDILLLIWGDVYHCKPDNNVGSI